MSYGADNTAPAACADCGRRDRSNGVWQAWSYQFNLSLCLDCYERRYVSGAAASLERSTQRTPVR